MIVYNFAAEYAALIIIAAILISFSKDYDAKAVEYSFIKTIYIVAFCSVMVTIAAMITSAPGTGTLHMMVAWMCNILYFIVIPSVSLCFLIYAHLITSLKFKQHLYGKEFYSLFVPYLLYLVTMTYALVNGKLFYITSAQGYIRGDWFELPYLLVAFHIVLVAITIGKNLKILPYEIKKTMVATTLLSALFLCVQFRASTTIMTGIIHTACILSIHLYALNVKRATDQLTGVYNRMYLIHTLELHIANENHFSLYVFSLSGMKLINERFGIEFGDKVLMRVAQIFAAHSVDRSVFRYGGDEFAFLLEQKHPDHQAIIDGLVADLDTPLRIDGNDVPMDFLCARVDYDLFGKNPRALISAVDYSLSSLKTIRSSKRYIYDTAVVRELIRRANMVQQIKDALDGNMFEVHYQPIYFHETGDFIQAEALVRMRNQDGYLVYPGDFIDLAVKTGLIVQMTYMILDRVCQDIRYLLDNCGPELTIQTVSVNFPYMQFIDEGMVDKVMAILNRYNVPATMIKIEITEREMVADTQMLKELMAQMSALGFGFELDDFGMDYSNISVVLGLPLESIKLDRSFLLAALENDDNMQFFRYLSTAILGIGSAIICEGVETQEQLDFALSCGCQYIQGYLFSRPLDRVALQKFLKKRFDNQA